VQNVTVLELLSLLNIRQYDTSQSDSIIQNSICRSLSDTSLSYYCLITWEDTGLTTNAMMVYRLN